MSNMREVEVFSAGCPLCEETVASVRRLACPSCKVTVRDMHASGDAARAAALGVRAVPAVAVDGRLADCCVGAGRDEDSLRRAGVGVPR